MDSLDNQIIQRKIKNRSGQLLCMCALSISHILPSLLAWMPLKFIRPRSKLCDSGTSDSDSGPVGTDCERATEEESQVLHPEEVEEELQCLQLFPRIP